MSVAAIACAVLLLQSGCRAEQPWPLWQTYRAKFIDTSGRVIDHSPGEGEKTTSEGMAYGMFFALVVNDRPTFDRLLHWTEDNLAGGDLTARLPSWSWGKNASGEWKVLDANSASDADLWMAYDLLEAGRLWKDARLEKLGEVMSDRIARSEVAVAPVLGTVLLPAREGFQPNASRTVLNPSYLPPQVLARLRTAQPAGPWGAVSASLPKMLQASSPGRFAMDWIAVEGVVKASPKLEDLTQGRTDAVPVGSYDAIRVYLWLGMADRGTDGVAAGLDAVSGMARYLASKTTPPLKVSADGRVLESEGTTGFSAAVIPYLVAVGQREDAKVQENRLRATLDASTGLYGRSAAYYDQNLAMFATGWMEGRFRFDRDGRLRLKWH